MPQRHLSKHLPFPAMALTAMFGLITAIAGSSVAHGAGMRIMQTNDGDDDRRLVLSAEDEDTALTNEDLLLAFCLQELGLDASSLDLIHDLSEEERDLLLAFCVDQPFFVNVLSEQEDEDLLLEDLESLLNDDPEEEEDEDDEDDVEVFNIFDDEDSSGSGNIDQDADAQSNADTDVDVDIDADATSTVRIRQQAN